MRREVDDLDAVLADPDLEPGTLRTLVAVDANWVLDDERSDDAAREWLQDLAARIRAVID